MKVYKNGESLVIKPRYLHNYIAQGWSPEEQQETSQPMLKVEAEADVIMGSTPEEDDDESSEPIDIEGDD